VVVKTSRKNFEKGIEKRHRIEEGRKRVRTLKKKGLQAS